MKIQYPEVNAISIWIGTFPTEDDFDQSVHRDVTSVLNLNVAIESICEISFEANIVSLHRLLEGFSGWQTFIEKAAHAGKEKGIERANAALICYYLKCENAPTKWGQLCFLGCFAGHDN
jgi:hypothetical protein